MSSSKKSPLRFGFAAALWLAGIASAFAQQYMPLPPGTIMGNVTSHTNPGSAVSLPQLIAAMQTTGVPLTSANTIGGLGTGVATWLGTPNSANLGATLPDKTGTGAAVFGTSPNITTPTGIVKGDVGLGNVSNIDTTNATNITTGTLPNARLSIPYFSAYPSAAATTVTTGVSTKMSINTKVSDSNTWFDAVTNFRFTPQLAGRYNVHVQVTCQGTTASACVGQIFKNGANYAQQQINGAAATQGANANTIITFNGSTDFVEAFVLVVCTGTCQYVGGTAPEQTLFEANYIGP
jgi:hypothetical protein